MAYAKLKLFKRFLVMFLVTVFASQMMLGMNPSHEEKSESSEQHGQTSVPLNNQEVERGERQQSSQEPRKRRGNRLTITQDQSQGASGRENNKEAELAGVVTKKILEEKRKRLEEHNKKMTEDPEYKKRIESLKKKFGPGLNGSNIDLKDPEKRKRFITKLFSSLAAVTKSVASNNIVKAGAFIAFSYFFYIFLGAYFETIAHELGHAIASMLLYTGFDKLLIGCTEEVVCQARGLSKVVDFVPSHPILKKIGLGRIVLYGFEYFFPAVEGSVNFESSLKKDKSNFLVAYFKRVGVGTASFYGAVPVLLILLYLNMRQGLGRIGNDLKEMVTSLRSHFKDCFKSEREGFLGRSLERSVNCLKATGGFLKTTISEPFKLLFKKLKKKAFLNFL